MKAETSIKIGGKDCVLVYDWDAIRQLEVKFGHELMGDVIANSNIAQLADIIECGLSRYNPEIKAEDVFDVSPPIIECRKAVDKALALAYFGTTEPEIDETSPKKKVKIVKLLMLTSLVFTLAYLLKHFGL